MAGRKVVKVTTELVGPDNNPPPDRQLTNLFRDMVKIQDEKTGKSWLGVFDRCMALHNENEMLRASVRQGYLLLQQQLEASQKTRAAVSERMGTLNMSVPEDVDTYRALLQLNESEAKTLTLYNRMVLAAAKEIRAAEYQSKFMMHVSRFNFFVMALHGILFKHLQNSPRLSDLQLDINRLAKTFELQEKNVVDEEHEGEP